MNKILIFLMFGLILTVGIFMFHGKDKTLDTIEDINLMKYEGVWFSIYEFPSRFQRDCTNTKAEYEVLESGKISVFNSCLRDGKVRSISGTAYPKFNDDNSKLIVNFGWFRKGDYYILHTISSPDNKIYDYALVGTPDRKYLWILSRKQMIEDKELGEMLMIAKERGFDVTDLVKVKHD